ncbi:MAG: PAS domain S-box protein [Gammaproteobacteria bacterium]|nr:PAS domain S-box protein [Gammaproteobacteria bacterium]MCH9743997.1 PAS domain S-box protein [Gammaproteobacteria bacterium]
MEQHPIKQEKYLTNLIKQIQTARNIDFSGYKTTSLTRRIARRIEALGLMDFESYGDYLVAQPSEYNHLIDSLLINVSAFFRNHEAWQTIQKEVIPKIIERAGDKIRIWSVGCATGEEAYTVAMLLAEYLGEDEFKRRVKIYATDIDVDALQKARCARYTEKDIELLPAGFLQKYFTQLDKDYIFKKDLRKIIIFGEHNIISDVPISKIHFISCRNLLIYLNMAAQKKVLHRLHYALGDGGFLLLGKAETLMINSQLFKSTNLRDRIFEKLVLSQEAHVNVESDAYQHHSKNSSLMGQQNLLRDVVSSCHEALVVLDESLSVRLINAQAQQLFGLSLKNIGSPFKDLPLSYQPVELRSKIKEVVRTKRPTLIRDKLHLVNEAQKIYLDIEIVPQILADGNVHGVLLYFYDKTELHQLSQELQQAKQKLLVVTDELQSANDELETTNEELQSTNEELETTNEELQSTNEELETSNEELQASNEELESSNAKLKHSTLLLDEYKYYNELMLNSFDLGIISVDNNYRVITWNEWNEKQWGLEAKEVVKKYLFDIEMGVDFNSIKNSILNYKHGRSVIDISARNRLGKTLECRLTVYPILKESGAQDGFILVLRDITENRQLENKLTKNREEYNHLSRLYTMGEMVNDLAHELSQPLTSIDNYVDGILTQLKKKNISSQELQDKLESVRKFSHQSAEIINRVRGFVQKDKSCFSWIKLSTLIDNAVDFFIKTIKEHNVQLTQFVDPDLNEVYVDVIQVNQILVNLIKNAIEAIREYPVELRHIIIRVQRFEGASFIMYLENSGPQFTQEEVDKMFDHYYTTKKSGLGLGLSISRSIANACGGDLTVRVRESGGVSFALQLPEIAKD